MSIEWTRALESTPSTGSGSGNDSHSHSGALTIKFQFLVFPPVISPFHL